MNDIDLLEKAKVGDEEALSKVYEQYLNLIFFKVSRFYLNPSEKDDFIQEGRIGLFKAIKAFDKNKGAAFSTFASICIERQLISAFKNSNNLRSKMVKMAITNHHEINNEQKIENTIFFNNVDPEALLIGKEKLINLKGYLKNNLSKLEAEVLHEMLLGFTYIEIAEKTGKLPKTIDNTMQRIKRKMKVGLKY